VVRRGPRLVTAWLGGIVIIAACATEPPPPLSPMRLLVKLVQPSSDAGAIASLVARGAGVPARYLAPASAQWHAIVLECVNARECEAALARLRGDAATFVAVERDERKRIVTP
jgi:hypothetical protein